MIYHNLRPDLQENMTSVVQGDHVLISTNGSGFVRMGVVTEKTPDYIETAVNANPHTQRVAWKNAPGECSFTKTPHGRIKDVRFLSTGHLNPYRKRQETFKRN